MRFPDQPPRWHRYTQAPSYFSSAPSPSWWPPATPASPPGSWPCRRTTCSWPCCGSSSRCSLCSRCCGSQLWRQRWRELGFTSFIKSPLLAEGCDNANLDSFRLCAVLRVWRVGPSISGRTDHDIVNRVVGKSALQRTMVTAWNTAITGGTSPMIGFKEAKLHRDSNATPRRETDKSRQHIIWWIKERIMYFWRKISSSEYSFLW